MNESRPLIGFKIEIIIEPDEDGFHAYCPALKGLHTSGGTEEEALQNARHAAIAYLESLMKHNDPIPVGVMVKEECKYSSTTSKSHARYHSEDLRVPCAT